MSASVDIPWLHPVMDAAAARGLEGRLLSDEDGEWKAMRRAGGGVALRFLADAREWAGFPDEPHILVLTGKGHNGGDALIAAEALLTALGGRVTVVPLSPVRSMRPLTARALNILLEEYPDHVDVVPAARARDRLAGGFDVILDGLFGMQFRPPPAEAAARLISWANDLPGVVWRVAVDVPSGCGESPAALAFRADLTYATGIFKSSLLRPENDRWCGRRRYVDIGFFDRDPTESPVGVVAGSFVAQLARPRPAGVDKRAQGHVFVVGGSRRYPGAALLAVEAALRSGAGLVTGFVPASAAMAFAARCPDAIWAGCSETSEGGLSMDTLDVLRERLERASALVIGPGLGSETEVRALLIAICRVFSGPLLLDADALHAEVLEAALERGRAPAPVCTPHAGEFLRLTGTRAGDEPLGAYCRGRRAVVLLKGPLTRVGFGERLAVIPYGGPVLARGGSGDVLSGIIGGLLAQGEEPFAAACLGAAWHGKAGDEMACDQRGARCARTSELANYLGPALESPE